jgi:hypothetical protein
MLAQRLLELVQEFYDTPRLFRITEQEPVTGRDRSQTIAVNQLDPTTGATVNDLTLGEYDVVITEQPMQITFENSQFQQALELRKVGVAVPDTAVLRHSNLTDKHDILRQMAEQQAQGDPVAQAEAELLAAKTEQTRAAAEKTRAEMVNKSVEAQYSAIQTAQTIAMIPETSGLADELLGSAGYVDRNAPPAIPQPAGGAIESTSPQPVPAPPHSNPLTPANPGVGLGAGIETPTAQDNVR